MTTNGTAGAGTTRDWEARKNSQGQLQVYMGHQCIVHNLSEADAPRIAARHNEQLPVAVAAESGAQDFAATAKEWAGKMVQEPVAEPTACYALLGPFHSGNAKLFELRTGNGDRPDYIARACRQYIYDALCAAYARGVAAGRDADLCIPVVPEKVMYALTRAVECPYLTGCLDCKANLREALMEAKEIEGKCQMCGGNGKGPIPGDKAENDEDPPCPVCGGTGYSDKVLRDAAPTPAAAPGLATLLSPGDEYKLKCERWRARKEQWAARRAQPPAAATARVNQVEPVFPDDRKGLIDKAAAESEPSLSVGGLAAEVGFLRKPGTGVLRNPKFPFTTAAAGGEAAVPASVAERATARWFTPEQVVELTDGVARRLAALRANDAPVPPAPGVLCKCGHPFSQHMGYTMEGGSSSVHCPTACSTMSCRCKAFTYGAPAPSPGARP